MVGQSVERATMGQMVVIRSPLRAPAARSLLAGPVRPVETEVIVSPRCIFVAARSNARRQTALLLIRTLRNHENENKI